MFGFGLWEIGLLLVIVVVFFGLGKRKASVRECGRLFTLWRHFRADPRRLLRYLGGWFMR